MSTDIFACLLIYLLKQKPGKGYLELIYWDVLQVITHWQMIEIEKKNYSYDLFVYVFPKKDSLQLSQLHACAQNP